PVLGENGFIHVQENNFRIDVEGRVWVNAAYHDDPYDPYRMVRREANQWEDTVLLDTLRIVDFELDRFLEKQGTSLHRDSFTSGPPILLTGADRPRVLQGFLEASNVDPVFEMVQMIEVNRAYEANQRVIQAEEQTLGTLINQVARFG
ncbi:MAG: flagellar biosynthesis protein FlgC, partial [Treponema sp.]|nr:flagellar biosynthesis protein FlgC [Treponema sp.]